KKTPETKDKKQTTKPRAVESVLDIFPDSNLARAVANKLNKTSVNDVVTQAELDSSIMWSCDFSNKDIKSLVGISRVKAYELNISNNQISDITPLASMKDMNTLNISNNQISDITPLASMKDMNTLNISNNQISDITPLASMKDMRMLIANNNDISDLNPLKNIKFGGSGGGLYLSNNKIKDLSVFKDSPLTEGFSFLDLSNNEIEDITPLRQHEVYELFNLDNNRLINISAFIHANIENVEVTWKNQERTIYVDWSNPLITSVMPIDAEGVSKDPINITNKGVYSNGNITWNDLEKKSQNLEFEWFDALDGADINNGGGFSVGNGKIHISVKAQHELTLNDNGREEKRTLYGNDLIKEPTVPTKQGYVFTGWYDARSGGTKWDFATDKMPDKDMTLYAQYSKQSYKVIFNNAGNKNEKSVQFETLVKEPTAPTKQGYTFAGWYDAETGGTKWDFTKDKMPASDLTLYARYEKNPDESTPVVTPPKSDTPTPTPRSPVITNSNSQETTIVNNRKAPNSALPKTGDLLSIGLPILGAGLLGGIGVWLIDRRRKKQNER
ncbi:InlB B-repeat-containing protein, partial [Listeria monocytogenes]